MQRQYFVCLSYWSILKPQGVPGNINGLPGVGITNIAEAFDQISAPGGKKSETTSPSIPVIIYPRYYT